MVPEKPERLPESVSTAVPWTFEMVPVPVKALEVVALAL